MAKQKIPRATGSENVIVRPTTWNRLAGIVEWISGLSVAPPLMLSDTQGGPLLSLAGTGNIIFAQLTSKAISGCVYAWEQIRPVTSGGWSVVTGGLTGTTSATGSPAVDLNSTDSNDRSGTNVVLVRTTGIDGNSCWVIADKVPNGFTGNVTVVTAVTWTGTVLQQTTQVLEFSNGRLGQVDSPVTTTIDTPSSC